MGAESARVLVTLNKGGESVFFLVGWGLELSIVSKGEGFRSIEGDLEKFMGADSPRAGREKKKKRNPNASPKKASL